MLENSWSLHDHFHPFSISIWLYKMCNPDWNHWIEGFCRSWNSRKNLETWTPLFYEIRIPPFIPWGHIPARKRFIDVSIYVIYIYLNIHMDVILLYVYVCIYIIWHHLGYIIYSTHLYTWLGPFSTLRQVVSAMATVNTRERLAPILDLVRAASQGRSWENDGRVVQNSGFS